MSPGVALPTQQILEQYRLLPGKSGECLSKGFVLSKLGTGLSPLAGRLGWVSIEILCAGPLEGLMAGG